MPRSLSCRLARGGKDAVLPFSCQTCQLVTWLPWQHQRGLLPSPQWSPTSTALAFWLHNYYISLPRIIGAAFVLEAVCLSESTKVLGRPSRPQSILAFQRIPCPLTKVVVLWQCIQVEVQKRTRRKNGHLDITFHITPRSVLESNLHI